MFRRKFPSRLVRFAVPGLVVLASAGPIRPAAATINYSWAAPVAGSLDEPSKWNPSGLPGVTDHLRFEILGSYNVTFPEAVPASKLLVCTQGNPVWTLTNAHTTTGLYVEFPSQTNGLVIQGGTLTTDYVQLGAFGRASTLTLQNPGTGSPGVFLHSRGINNPSAPSFGDHIGHDGISTLNVFGGSRYYSDQVGGSWPMEIATTANATATVAVAGASVFPTRYSQLVVGANGLTVGAAGTANLFANNGGGIDCAGPMMVGRSVTSAGYVTVGPVSGPGTSFLNVGNDLLIGNNGLGPEAGHGEVTLNDRAWITVAGKTVIGDPDNVVDKQSVLRIKQGGTFTAAGGLRVLPTSGPALDLQGGVTQVTGGTLSWPAGRTLNVGSTSGTPELRIANGAANVAPSTSSFLVQLHVGGSGAGKVFVTGTGTTFPMGAGAAVIADGAGSTGTLEVDEGATLTSGGPLHVGAGGTGVLNVHGGSLVDGGFVQVGLAAGANGTVHAAGAGSVLRARQNVWIGGHSGGPGGPGLVQVEQGAALELLKTDPFNDARVTIHPGTGRMELRTGGRLVTTGAVECRGVLALDAGTVAAGSVSVPPGGAVEGTGTFDLTTGLVSSGEVRPGLVAGGVGTLAVNGTFRQFPTGTFVADLAADGLGRSDLLAVSGDAVLGGTLSLRPGDGFVGTPGTVYTVLIAGAVVGTFDTILWDGAPPAGQVNVLVEPGAVRVVIPSSTGVEPVAGAAPGALRFAAGPERGRVSFTLDLPAAAHVDATLYDVRGREVGSLFTGALGAGRHALSPRDGSVTASGAYFARAVIRSGDGTTVRTARCLLVR